MKFRNKPIEIEAVQWKGWFIAPRTRGPLIEGLEEVTVDHYSYDVACELFEDSEEWDMCELAWMQTNRGGKFLTPGDWVITWPKGERTPCKRDIFEATYEKVV